MNINGFNAADEVESEEAFGLIEEGLNEIFESETAPYVRAQFGGNDTIALNEAFNDWIDVLCTDGLVSNYVYENATRNE